MTTSQPPHLPTVLHVPGQLPFTIENDYTSQPAIGEGVICDGRRYRVADVWHEHDRHAGLFGRNVVLAAEHDSDNLAAREGCPAPSHS
jgi:hypothetical protein